MQVIRMDLPLVMAALSGWSHHHLYLALGNTVLWNRDGMIHLPVVCCGRTVPSTLIFNEGRQRLNGNGGYRVIEANSQELLNNSPTEQS